MSKKNSNFACKILNIVFMKKYFLAIALFGIVALLSSCEPKLEPTVESIVGHWVESYKDYPNFMQDGSIEYTFDTNRNVSIFVYDALSGKDTTIIKSYDIGEMGPNVLTFNIVMSDFSGENWTIIKLTKNEMDWQRMGTTFSPGSVGGDFRHLVRVQHE